MLEESSVTFWGAGARFPLFDLMHLAPRDIGTLAQLASAWCCPAQVTTLKAAVPGREGEVFSLEALSPSLGFPPSGSHQSSWMLLPDTSFQTYRVAITSRSLESGASLCCDLYMLCFPECSLE